MHRIHFLARSTMMSCVLITALLFGKSQLQAEPGAIKLPQNAKLAIIGDSITEGKLYSMFIESYLLACAGRQDVQCFQFGWSGETAALFKERMWNDLDVFKPDSATICYGMNDGTYQAYNDVIGSNYETAMRSVITGLQKMGVKQMVVGTPGAVDTHYFQGVGSAVYNDNLAKLGAIDLKLAGEFSIGFANVHQTMMDAMSKAKAARGANYDVCGMDGVHPQLNGHLLMALSFLKALGCDGDLGTFTLDMKGPSSASGKHKASGENGWADIESAVYPFCFDANTEAASSPRSILPYCDFNQSLNRLVLKVNNLETAKGQVNWNGQIKVFTREELTKGINLNEAFATTPFDGPFLNFMWSLYKKQSLETVMIKGFITNYRELAEDAKTDRELAAAMEKLKQKLMEKRSAKDAEVRKLLVPVKHALQVLPIQ